MKYHVYIWQSCINIFQIWMDPKDLTDIFAKLKISLAEKLANKIDK